MLGPAGSSGMWKRQQSDSDFSRHDHDGSAPCTPTNWVSHFPDEELEAAPVGDGEMSGGSKLEEPFGGGGEDEEDPHPEQDGAVVLFVDREAGHSSAGHEEDDHAEERSCSLQDRIELCRHFGLDPRLRTGQ